MLSTQPLGSRGTVAKSGVKMTAATGDEESAHVELPPKPTPQFNGSPSAETKEVTEVWYGGHHTLVVGPIEHAKPTECAIHLVPT